MSSFRFVHAADLHIDSPLRGLSRYEGAPVDALRGATRRAFENLINLCIDEEAAFLILAGDLFDGSWKDYSTGLYFVSQLARLREHQVRVFIVRGNHDASMAKELTLPEHVHVFGSRKPTTERLEDIGVAIHGQSFPSRVVLDNLASAYPPAIDGVFNIGVLHTALDGREGHDAYAPCTKEQLASHGYSYWALGHVHEREIVHRDPWICFPGNLQGRHARECGPKGALVVSVENGFISETPRHVPLDVVRWASVEVRNEAAQDAIDAVRESLELARSTSGERLLAVRLTIRGLVGKRDRFEADVRALGIELGDVWIEKIRTETGKLDWNEPRLHADVASWIKKAALEAVSSPEALQDLRAQLRPLLAKLPAAEREELPDIEGLLPDAAALLLERLDERAP